MEELRGNYRYVESRMMRLFGRKNPNASGDLGPDGGEETLGRLTSISGRGAEGKKEVCEFIMENLGKV